ncbi:MAG: site-specific DNA-methyltransferase [Tissierellia bacterium]|nr:site-specific DNA-methyltransferase [Tissierellia bacterium]
MNEKYLNKIVLGDSRIILKDIEENSVDIVLTDPPYFLDKLDNNWDTNEVHSKKNQQAVKSLPAGMKFSRQQGIDLYNWYYEISKEIFRVLKPGGFFFTFSSPRLYHRVASAVDDVGFEIRDSFIWLYTQNQPKAMSLNHVVRRRKNLNEEEKEKIIKKMDGWKTPQLKSCYEPIVIGQKPVKGGNLDNFLENEVCLVNTNVTTGENMFPANVISVDNILDEIDRIFLVDKPTKKEKGEYNTHKTVKPLSLCKHLIRLTVYSDKGVVLDPFVGSGTTAVAAKMLGKNYIGIELNNEYVDIANRRLSEID